MNHHLLSIDNLSISFRTYRGVLEATHQVSLVVDAGETVGIVGESGCGKSVTAHAVMKLLPGDSAIYSSGHIFWDGRDIRSLDESAMNRLRGRDMAMIFQDPMTALNPVLTIGDQIEEGLRQHHMSRQHCPYCAKWASRRQSGGCTNIRMNCREGCASDVSSPWRYPVNPACCLPMNRRRLSM